jgi:hypothetical protein
MGKATNASTVKTPIDQFALAVNLVTWLRMPVAKVFKDHKRCFCSIIVLQFRH